MKCPEIQTAYDLWIQEREFTNSLILNNEDLKDQNKKLQKFVDDNILN